MSLSKNTLYRKIKRNVQDRGILYTLRTGVLFLFKKFYQNTTYRIYRVDLTRLTPKSFKINGVNFKLLEETDNDPSIIQQIETMSEWLHDQVRSKLSSNSICLVALNSDKVIGFNLVTFKEIFLPLINIKNALRPNAAWSEQITVSKKYRKKGLATLLRYKIFLALKRRGIKKLYGATLVSNIANLKLSRKVGFKEFVDVHYIKILNRSRWTCKRLRS